MENISYPEEVIDLIESFSRLPGIGKVSAERIVLCLLNDKKLSKDINKSILSVMEKVINCEICGFFSCEKMCMICKNNSRNRAIICVVEDVSEIISIERSQIYKGLYHSLGGKLSPLDDIGPGDISIDPLIQRISNGSFEEIIFALGSDIESEATTNYIIDKIKQKKVNLNISRLAQGLSVGRDLKSSDSRTIAKAISARTKISG